jgi:hypothetical protein
MHAYYLVFLAVMRIFIGMSCTFLFLCFCFVVFEISKAIIYERKNKWSLSKSQRLANAVIRIRTSSKYMMDVWAMKLLSALSAVDIATMRILIWGRMNGAWILLKGMGEKRYAISR